MNVTAVCAKVGMSRQNYYARRRLRQRREVDGELVAHLVRRERCLQPRLGARKLFYGPINQVLPAATAARWVDGLAKTVDRVGGEFDPRAVRSADGRSIAPLAKQ